MEGERCHLKARVTAGYVKARPLDEDLEDLELQIMDSEDEFDSEEDESDDGEDWDSLDKKAKEKDERKMKRPGDHLFNEQSNKKKRRH